MTLSASPKRYRVLVVDDHRDGADSLAFFVRSVGYEVRVAYDGVSGLQAARDFLPDCVISDIDMPGMDGCALARMLRTERAAIKLVAISGRIEEKGAEIAEAGFDERLRKPADLSFVKEILAMMEQIKELATQTRELAQQNVVLAGDAKQLLQDVKQDVREVKQELKDTKKQVQELKMEVKELKREEGQ
ncbi:MAG: response regulator [Gemmataceae bacterium]|nr:response regulator [Gemmataceae bacterium]